MPTAKHKKEPSKTTKKNSGGRPSKFPKINPKQLKFLYLDGKTDKQVAEFLEIDLSTLTRWKQKHERFCTSLRDWKAEADAKVEKSLYQRATGYTHEAEEVFCSQGEVTRAKTKKHFPPDPTSMIFWLKNRQPDKWREKIEADNSGKVKHTHTHKVGIVDLDERITLLQGGK